MKRISIGRAGTPHLEQHALEAMFRFRHKIFFERLGWEVADREGREVDAYDALDPVYMVCRNHSSEVEGCWRLLPTTGPYMLKDTFPELLAGEGAPVDPQVWELSRFAAVSPSEGDLAQVGVSPATFAMVRAMLDFGMRHGIREYVTVTSVAVERLMKRLGLPLQRFGDGKARRVGRVLSVACRMSVAAGMESAVCADIPWQFTGEVA